MSDYFPSFALWDLVGWILASHLPPSALNDLRQSLNKDPAHVRDAGLGLGLDRTSDNPPRYRKSQLDRKAA